MLRTYLYCGEVNIAFFHNINIDISINEAFDIYFNEICIECWIQRQKEEARITEAACGNIRDYVH